MRLRNQGTHLRRILAVLLFLSAWPAWAQQWEPLGPEGGSVRSLAFDSKNPDRIFLGTSAGRLYLSSDGGASWSRWASLGAPAEMVLDHVVIDPSNPKNIYVAAWNAQAPNSDGDLFRSRDGGKRWEVTPDLHGKSIRALAMAVSDPRTLVAGGLDGVFRSRDGGDTWQRVSPENHAEIKNVESVAIDPANPDIIYAGTWHLPWKTEDGGQTWHSIKKGVIDDSDVFSIVVDGQNSANLYISACSGIYRSDSAGELFRKIQGIPYSARRTRVLRIDPRDGNVVYAGTTEGLWKTTDGGANWKRMTGANVVVNDVMIDPRQPARILLATDRGGVLASEDGGVTFAASNRGFTHRQVAALLVDQTDSRVVYAGLLNDKEFGGVFVSRDRGQTWSQLSEGLDGRDVFVLRQAADNSLLAGTDHGIFLLPAGSSRWIARNGANGDKPDKVKTVKTDKPDKPVKTDQTTPTKSAVAGPGLLNARILDLQVASHKWFAVTSSELSVSLDSGLTWSRLEVPGLPLPLNLAVADRMVVAASRNTLAISADGGETWLPTTHLQTDFSVNGVSVDANGNIWLAAQDGLFRSSDAGESWKKMNGLRLANVVSIEFDEAPERILVTGAASSSVYESVDHGRTWAPINSGWLLRNVRSAHGRLLGLTPFDGVIIQPETSASTTSNR
ncbi:MAG TPA: transcriptional regulator [Candidatus Angelobacter sp.]|nr:transcriptional regulator [Candidatus Angelobacter sp.]